MAEREYVINKQTIDYEGLFEVKELYKLIDTFLKDRNYDKREMKNVEVVRPEGKYIEIELEPWKQETDYFKNLLHIRLIISNLKEVEVEKENVKKKVNQGKVKVIMDAIVETDSGDKWENKPLFFFIRTLFNKYFFKPFTVQYRGKCAEDLQTLASQIKSFLNIYR